jgi:catechol 2,3-dioxygenase-like lactoylglutathione lyase family enzyme
MSEPAIRTSAIDHVVLYASDVKRSVVFYTEILGMTVRSDGPNHAFLRCGDGGQQIGLFAAGKGGPPTDADVNHIAFRVEAGDYEMLKGALEARDVAVRGRAGDPDCIYFDDPDGHTLQIVVPKRG